MSRLGEVLFGSTSPSPPSEKKLVKAQQAVVNARSDLRDAENTASWKRQPMPKFKAEKKVERERARVASAEQALAKLIERRDKASG